MENESRIGQLLDRIKERVAEQEWFQQLKGKWDELDPQSRTYAKFGAAGASLLVFLLAIISSIWSVQSLKSELQSKQELLAQLQASSDELNRLKGQSSSMGDAGTKPDWPAYFNDRANRAGIDGGSVEVSAEKAPASPTGSPASAGAQTREAVFDLQIKHVSIKQVVRFAFQLENGEKPVKLKTLAIDTKSDPAGYMDATLSVSAFSTVASK